MSRFKDSTDTEWTMSLNVGLIEDIKENTDFDLDELMREKSKLGNILLAEPHKLVSVFYAICERQIKERGLSPKDFARLFDRQTIDSATECFIESIMDFYPRAAAGAVLKESLPAMFKKMDEILVMKARKASEKVLSDMHTN